MIIDLADQVRTAEGADAPSWAVERRFLPSADLVAEIQVWRAAMQVQPADLRPTGPIQSSLLGRTWQLRLDKQLVAADLTQDQQWTNLLVKRIPNVIKDFVPAQPGRQTGTLASCRLRCDRSRPIRSSQRTVPR